MRLSFHVFGREVFAVEWGEVAEEAPEGIEAGSGGQFEVPFGFHPGGVDPGLRSLLGEEE